MQKTGFIILPYSTVLKKNITPLLPHFSAVLINHPYQKINAPLKFNILLHKLLPLLF